MELAARAMCSGLFRQSLTSPLSDCVASRAAVVSSLAATGCGQGDLAHWRRRGELLKDTGQLLECRLMIAPVAVARSALSTASRRSLAAAHASVASRHRPERREHHPTRAAESSTWPEDGRAEPDMTRVDKGYGEAQGPPEGFAIGIRAGMPAAPIVQLDAYQRWLLSR